MTAPRERPTLTDLPGPQDPWIPRTGQQLALDATHEAAMLAERRTAQMPAVYTGPATGDQLSSLEVLAALAQEPTPADSRPPGRHASRATLRERHGARFASFSVIGAVVLVLGILVQALLVRARAGSYGSYAGQAVFSVELSYLLNYRFTWRDRDSPFWASCWRFAAQKLALTVPNLALYALLVSLGARWLAANLATTAVFTLANYVTGDLWSFAARMRRHRVSAQAAEDAEEIPHLPAGLLPRVSIVIPCKSNERTIGATVASLLGQDYPALAEVILVGDVGDSTWAALADVRDPRLILLEQEKTPGQRDPNVKRHKGLTKASGDLLALADSDIVMDPRWLSKAVALLADQGGGLVAGGMRAIRPHKFWPRFVDRNSLAAKTSRVGRPYFVTAENFGAHGRKPPLTANAVFTRWMYDSCPLDAAWAYGYEDYEWYWRLAKDGHTIRYHRALTAAHHHREKFTHLLREYRRSAQGCAQFVRRHPDSPLAAKRRRQAFLLPALCMTGIAVTASAIAAGYGPLLAAAAAAGVAGLAAWEGVRSKSLEAVAYPAAALALGGMFTATLAGSLMRPGDRSAPVWDATREEDPHPPRTLPFPAGPGRRLLPLAVIGAALVLGAVARLWDIGAAPEWQLDEITYNSIALNLVQHGTLNVPLAFQQTFQPFLYHPPFYPYELSLWYRLAGAGITQARVLGVLSEMAAFGLLARFLARAYGTPAAALATTLIMSDGWLLYAGRISYIENSVLGLMMAALVLFQRAASTHRMAGYLAAGVMTGAAATFNNDAGYLIAVLAVHWLLTRRDLRQHAAAIGAAVAVLGAYIVAVSRAYTIGGTNWWWHDTLVQLRRLTGGQASAGTLTGPGQFLDLLMRQYDLFLPSVTAAAAAAILLGWRLIRCARERRLAPLGPDMLLPAWAIGALAVFGPASLHYSQYFVMVLLPLYSYLWVSVWPWLRGVRLPGLLAGFSAVIVLLGCGSAFLRLSQDSNAFRQFQQYAATRIPRGDLVVAGTAGDPIAYLISQPWCSPGTDLSAYCSQHASYVVTWETFLQPANPMHLVSLQLLLGRSEPVAEFSQFSGTITVWKVSMPARPAAGNGGRR